MSRRSRLAAAALLLLAAAAWAGPRLLRREQVIRESRFLLGTMVEISLVGRDREAVGEALEAAFREVERIDTLLGSHGQGGELERVNREAHPGGAAVSRELLDRLLVARRLGQEAAGAFDPTVGPLMALWDFEGGGRVPGEEEIRRARGSVGWDKLLLDEAASRVVFTVPGMKLDLGGTGQGYAADRAADLLRGRGLPGGIVNGGGELVIWGRRPDGGPWRIGIQHPRQPERLLGTLTLTDRAVATSGDYERFFTAGGRRYAHILDPATGFPAEGCQSVTVVAARAEEADILSTAALVLGPVRGRRLLEEHGAEGIIVDAEGGVHVTPGLAASFSPAS